MGKKMYFLSKNKNYVFVRTKHGGHYRRKIGFKGKTARQVLKKHYGYK